MERERGGTQGGKIIIKEEEKKKKFPTHENSYLVINLFILRSVKKKNRKRKT